MSQTQVGGVGAQLLGQLVELHLQRVAGLWRAVPALGSARRFVGERAGALELVSRDRIGDGLQRARVIGARDAIGAVAAAVQQALEVHRGNGAVLRHAGLHPHQRGVAPTVAVEHFFARQRDLDRTTRDHRELRDDDLMAERIALAAEAAAVRRGDDADARGRELEHFGQRPVHVMRRLGAAPQRELAVGGPLRHGRVLLHRQVGVALVEEQVLAHQVSPREARLHVAELEVNELVEVAAVAVVVDAGLGVGDGVLGVGDGAQRLVLDGHEVERRSRDVFVHGRHGRDRIADEPDLVRRERVLVLAHREDAEGDREVFPGQHGFHPGEPRGLRRVDADDLGVRMRAAQ